MCDQKLGSFFFLSCDTRNLLSSIIPYNMIEEILFLRVLLIIWFLLDRNALRFSLNRWPILLLGKYSKPGAVWSFFFFFNFLFVASLRCSLVYLCVQVLFSVAVLHLLVKWISGLKGHSQLMQMLIANAYVWFRVEVNAFQTDKSSVQVSAVP